VLTAADVLDLQRTVDQVRVDESLVDYALEIVRRTRESDALSLGVSPRGSLMLYHAAQAMAFLNGRKLLYADELQAACDSRVCAPCRVNAGYASAHKKAQQAEAVLAEILAGVRVPV